jgi:hypothetical protein
MRVPRAAWSVAVAACISAACGLFAAEARAGIADPPAASTTVRHKLRWSDVQALQGQRLKEASASRLLAPELKRLLGNRYDDFKSSLVEESPLRLEGDALVGDGVVPGTLGYRGAFFVVARSGEMLAVIKSGRHGTTIERFGSLQVLKDPHLLHTYQEFIGIDE